MKRRVSVASLIVAAVAAIGAPTGALATGSPGSAAGIAPGAPGAESYFDLARKDCVGTARNTGSKVWFTVADGVLSDVYWPTVDATNVHTLQYLVTDGHSFTDLQTRDMSYRVVPDPTGMSCTVIASDTAHHYRITTTVVLTGQGSGSPPVRNFTATAQPFSFGVCAPGGTSPICSADPNTVPTVMDTITPAGVSQHVELDPTLGPAVLHGVPVP